MERAFFDIFTGQVHLIVSKFATLIRSKIVYISVFEKFVMGTYKGNLVHKYPAFMQGPRKGYSPRGEL